jgi:hypothetical protein
LEKLHPEMFRLDPEMFKVQLPEMPQTQKKEVSTIMRKKRKQYKDRKYQDVKREKMTTAFNLLRECVPGIEKVGVTNRLNRPDMMMKTVSYIKELQNEIKKESKKRVKELEHKENYIQELQKKIKELETPQTHSSEPEIVLASDPTGASTSSTMDVTTTSEADWVALGDLGEFIPPEELLESGIPDFNSMEDFIQWIKL